MPQARASILPGSGASLIFSVVAFFLVCVFASGRLDFFDSVGPWLNQNMQVLLRPDQRLLRVLFTGLGVVFAWFAAISVHELGHLVAGLAAGFRVKYLQVSRIRISFFQVSYASKTDKRLGAVSFHPEAMRNRPWRCACMTLAGPLSNLLVAVVILKVPIHRSLPIGAFVAWCLYVGVWNLAPLSSDGKKLLILVFRRRQHEAKLAMTLLFQQLQQGVEREKLDPNLIADAAQLRERSSLTVLGNAFAYGKHYDRQEFEAAAASLEVCLSYSPWASVGMRQALICDAAILQANRGHLELAEAWFREIPPGTKLRSRLKAEAAIFEARGEIGSALQKVAECEELLQQEPSGNKRELALLKLRKWKCELEGRVATSSV
jgi:hypothetical protein